MKAKASRPADDRSPDDIIAGAIGMDLAQLRRAASDAGLEFDRAWDATVRERADTGIPASAAAVRLLQRLCLHPSRALQEAAARDLRDSDRVAPIGGQSASGPETVEPGPEADAVRDEAQIEYTPCPGE